MKLRKSQRIMSLFLSLLMLLSTFAGSGFTVRAAEDADEPAIVDEVNDDTTTSDDTTGSEEDPEIGGADAASIVEPHNLGIYLNDATSRSATTDVAKASKTLTTADTDYNAASLAFSSQLTNRTYTIKADYSSGDDQDYADLDWVISSTNTAPYTPVTSFPKGISIVAEGATVSISGRAEEAAANKQLYFIATDKDTSDTGSEEVIIIPFTLGVADLGVTEMAQDIKETSAQSHASQAIRFGASDTKGSSNAASAKMGYTVSATDPEVEEDKTLLDYNNVKPIELTLATTALDEDKAVAVSFSIKNEKDENAFSVEPASGTLDKNHPIKVTISPATGLVSEGAGKKYTDSLVISSDAFASDLEVGLEFTVTTDLILTAMQNKTEIKAGTGNSFALGDFEVGKAIKDIVITAAGGDGTVSFAAVDGDELPDGITVTPSSGSKQATLTISGTPTAKAYKWSEANASKQTYDNSGSGIAISAKDGKTLSTVDGTISMAVKPASVTYADENGESFAAGSTVTGANSYAKTWNADLSDEISNSIQITNKSGIELTFDAALEGGGSNTGEYALVNSEIKVAAGATEEVKFKSTKNPTNDDVVTITLTGDGIKKTVVTFTVAAQTAGKISTSTLKDAEVGTAYSATLEAASDVTGDWVIVTSDTDAPEETAGTKTTAAYIRDTYGLTLNKDTGVLSGTPKKVVKGLPIKVTKGEADAVELKLTIKVASSALKIVGKGAEISTSKKLAMDKLYFDDAVGTSDVITITNKKSVDLGDLTAEIQSVSGTYSDGTELSSTSTASDIFKYFKLTSIDADGAEVATTASSAAITLLESKNYALTLSTQAPKAGDLKPGTYEVTVELSGTNVKTQSFTATVTVKSALTISVGSKMASTGSGEGFIVNQKVSDAANYAAANYTFTAKVDGAGSDLKPAEDEVGFSWTAAEGSSLPEGLTLTDSGLVTGTPTKAGEYKVIVSAVGGGDTYKGINGTLEYTVVVKGSATLTVKATVGSTSQQLNNGAAAVILNGAAVGDEIDSLNAGVQIDLAVTGAAVTKGLKIGVESVDTRTDEAKKKNVKDVHEGSEAYIGTSVSELGAIAKDGTASFRVIPKSTAKAGDYLVKVTVSGDEATTTSFYVEYVVAEKLAITTPSASLNAGVGDDYRLRLEATGTNSQTITWYEVQKKATAETNGVAKGSFINNITASGTNNEDPDDNTRRFQTVGAAGITGLYLTKDSGSVLDDTDLEAIEGRAWVGGSAARSKGVVSKKGSFDITVRAESAAVDATYTTRAENAKDSDGNVIVRSLTWDDNGTEKDVTYYKASAIGTGIGGNASNGAAGELGSAIPTQNAEVSFKLVVAETEKVSITNISTDADGSVAAVASATAIAADKTNGTNDATAAQKAMFARTAANYKSDGITITKVTGYTYKEAPKDTAATSAETLALTISNEGGVALSSTKAALKAGADSAFELADTSGTVNADKYEDIIASITANGTYASLNVAPKTATLKKTGTYTDTLVITNDNMKTIEFPVSLTVVDPAKTMSVYQKGEKNTDATPKHLDGKDTEVVLNNTLTAEITLATEKKGAAAPASNIVFIENVGNVAFDLSIEEVKDADGTAYGSTTETHKLNIGTTANPTGITAVTVASGTNVVDYETDLYIKLSADSVKTAGEQTAYLKFSWTGEDYVIVPVKYTVYDTNLDNDVTVTPADNTIEFLKSSTATEDADKYYAENYDSDAIAAEVTLNNGNSGDASKALYNVKATIDDRTKFAFIYSDSTKIGDGTGNETVLSLGTVAAAGSISFKVTPVSGLRAGTYSGSVTITADNLSSPIIRTLKIKVLESDEYKVDVIELAPSNADELSLTDAQRLYQSLVVSKKISSVVTSSTNDSTEEVVIYAANNEVAVKLSKGEVIVMFTSSDNLSSATTYDDIKGATITAATIAKTSGAISTDSFSISLNAEDIGAITTQTSTAKAGTDYFKKMTFSIYSTVTFDITGTVDSVKESYSELKNDAVDVTESSATEDKVDVAHDIIATINNNKALGSVFNNSQLPTGVKSGLSFDGWEADGIIYDANSLIKQNVTLTPHWHSHKYSTNPNETETKYVEWTWTKLDSGEYTAKLTLHCTEASCPDYEGSKVELTDVAGGVVVTKNVVEADCEHGKSVKYSAEVTYNSVKFTSEYYDETGDSAPLGHDWGDAVIVWGAPNAEGVYDTSSVTVTRTCKTDPTHVVELTVVSVNAERLEPECEKEGAITYSVTYTDVDKNGKAAGNVTDTTNTKKVTIPAKGHSKTPELVVTGFDETTLKATVKATCPDCGTELYNGELTAAANADGTYTFSFVSSVDGETYTVVWSNHEHVWTVAFDWTGTTATSATAKAVFTCTVGGETKEVAATTTVKKDTDTMITYAANVSAEKSPDGVEHSESYTVDKNTGEGRVGEGGTYVYKSHSFTWAEKLPDSGNPAVSASVVYTVTYDDDTSEEVSVAAIPTVEETARSEKRVTYKATITTLDGVEKSESKSYDAKTGDIKNGGEGTPTVEGGDIVIIGVEETYPYTGAKIKPAVTVMDGDIVLAQSTDYTVSYTGKNKIGEVNTVEVKGKGNYSGKSAVVKFTIVDPRADIEADELAAGVKKVVVSDKSFTYNGTAQYPKTVTITLSDKSTITYNVDEDGTATTDSEKKVGLSFSNNINKGTATVAATGADGKTKKASYKIQAADISTATFEIEGVTWGVKAEAAKISGTFGEDELELVAGQDFKVSYKAANAGETAGIAKISGKGNFKGKHADVTYTVSALGLEDDNVIVTAISGKKVSTVKVQVVDNAGNALGKKLYSYEVQDADGTALDKKAALPEEITVVVKSTGSNATTDESGISVSVKPGSNLGSVKFKVDKSFFKYYTGEAVTLSEEDFAAGKIDTAGLKLGEDFEIASYKNNVKKGSMTVTLQGIGSYSGTKAIKVKIAAKPIDKAVSED